MVSIGIARVVRTARGAALFLVAAAAVVMLATGSGSADELPLMLSNANIGMSGDEIEASHTPEPAAEPEPTKAPEPAPYVGPPESEFVYAEGAAPPACGVESAAAAGVTSFGHCIEMSIRGGVGFDESARVCRAIFPERG